MPTVVLPGDRVLPLEGRREGGREGEDDAPSEPLGWAEGSFQLCVFQHLWFLGSSTQALEILKVFLLRIPYSSNKKQAEGAGRGGLQPLLDLSHPHSHGDKTGLRVGDDCRHFPA